MQIYYLIGNSLKQKLCETNKKLNVYNKSVILLNYKESEYVCNIILAINKGNDNSWQEMIP